MQGTESDRRLGPAEAGGTVARIAAPRRLAVAAGLAGFAASAALTLGSLAQARVEYPAAQTLSEAGQSALDPQVAVDSQDRATVVWRRFDGANYRIQSVRLGADGTPGAVQTLSAAGQDAVGAQVAIDSQDRATVVWSRSDGAKFRVQSVRLGADGAPGAVQNLSAAGQDAFNPQVAVDSQDRATVVWRRSGRIQAIRLGADGAPGAVQNLSEAGGDAQGAQVAIDSQDRATVVWRRDDGTSYRVQSVRLDADGTPKAVQTLSAAGEDAQFPQVAVDSQDRATVVWRRSDGANLRIQSVRLGADSAPGAVQNLSEAGQHATQPQVALDSRDRATVVWRRSDGTNSRIQSVRLAADGTPGTVQDLSEAGQDALNPQVALDSQDRATVVWDRSDGANSRIQSVRLGAGGVPETVQDLSEAGQNAEGPQVAIDSQDRPTVVWERFDGARRIQSVRGEIVAPDTRIDSGPLGTTSDPTPTFTFSSDEEAVRFSCRVDGGAFGPCSGPGASHTTAQLPDGPHTFAVRAVDVTGDADPTPAERTFTVDTTAPPDGAPPDGADTAPPGLVLSGQEEQRLRERVVVVATCTDEACTATGKGRLRIRGKRGGSAIAAAKKGREALRLGKARKQLEAGETKRLPLKVKRKGGKAARRALERDRGVIANVKVKATDAAGNPSFGRRKVRLRR